ncbi:MAG: outer membrane beta-barrel protein, partial [Proteobacteria bacterium]|nr:outer membrane beta-barrel protein [Pseudomonadota bacterium]
ATPVAQNNGTIWNLLWTHTDGPWVINPYIQYSTTPKDNSLGLPSSGSTLGAAILAKYSVNSMFNVAARAEYISSSGSGVSLLYGPKSDAWSLTITPTLQFKTFFIRGELAYVKVEKGSKGFEFGAFADKDEQSRAMIETGVLF